MTDCGLFKRLVAALVKEGEFRKNGAYMGMRVSVVGLAEVVLLIVVAAQGYAAETNGAVTFNKDVLPILQKNCQTCHRPGQIGPMSLLSYKEARPWAKAIKEAVRTKKMPP